MGLIEAKRFRIATIQSLAPDSHLHPVQQAWLDCNAPQCGYCQTGQIMTITDFLRGHPNPTDEDIDKKLSNICRRGTYTRMRQAIHPAAGLLSKQRAKA